MNFAENVIIVLLRHTAAITYESMIQLLYEFYDFTCIQIVSLEAIVIHLNQHVLMYTNCSHVIYDCDYPISHAQSKHIPLINQNNNKKKEGN